MGLRSKTNWECELRREKVGLCLARGMRSPTLIGRELNAHKITILKDIVLLKKRRNRSKSYEEQQEQTLLTTAQGYLSDIQELDELIQKAKIDKGLETELTAEAAAGDKDEFKKNAVHKKKQTTKGVNYNSLANLFQLKLKARRELAELYDLLEPEAKRNLFKDLNLTISNTVINNTKTTINLEAISDADLIRATKTLEDRGSPTIQTPAV